MAVLEGVISGNKAEIDANNQLKIVPSTVDAQTGKIRSMMENDGGTVTGSALLKSPEVDGDYRHRIAHETLLDNETFNYAAQNTGKHNYLNTTMTIAWSSAGMQTNSGSITTTTTGVRFRTYAYFPMFGATSIYVEFEASFNANFAATNSTLDYGLFLDGGTTPYAPTDGVFFRLNSSGLFGVINYNTSETTSTPTPFAFTPTANRKYKFVIQCDERNTYFWIDDILYGSIPTPVGQGQPFISAALPLAVRQANTGAASAALQFTINDYTVSLGGMVYNDTMGTIGNRVSGSYQGLSGGTMGTLANYANSANPTAAVPTNTTAALGTGLGGQFWETATLALNTDGIICSYQVPAGTAAVQGKRLRINGIHLQSYIQTLVAGGPFNAQFSLAFGHTAVSLATAEAASTKAPRRVPLPAFTQLVTAAQAVNTMVSQPGGSYMAFTNPIYVNPGEFIALVTKHVGTVASAGVIAHMVSFDYGWE